MIYMPNISQVAPMNALKENIFKFPAFIGVLSMGDPEGCTRYTRGHKMSQHLKITFNKALSNIRALYSKCSSSFF